ncbi:MAG: F0F1 ATP synthase subunit epsilon [Candidatus Methanoperedens sp.]|uniref:F0F1 ATP synthase subunit epsilon n=1 Tax=Candidatus Methanoperedens sp. BLZ2 TaxID=2035255 RepID=UPI000BE2B06F|nr:F0F1 ATP synthase subunit epsilon [Candidatus Methanoperedens sp. BLZ2]KAB2947985.1 MAG: F0F1 ATP synthase subunit epsilon [Candidatus Methanoperedens sp.]MBZ0174106.1 F0F1 ATP synthase subunit epsilon [Candidatus Methanoperedens nitroreducens]MCX9079102.1 F0F1 ATP synthase subunit epsilon [Candidatus Methanoperedens sp.]
MRLKIMLPTKVLIDQDVTKVVAEAENGSFGILPKHIDFVTALVSGILSFEYDNKEEFLAVDEGILVKWGSDVFVSTRNAVRSKDLGRLKQTVKEEFYILDEREKKSRSVIARLEADFAKRILELE